MADRMITNDATGITTNGGTSPSLNQLTPPLSPIVHLQNLNDRFASYIERVTVLDGENALLNSVLATSKESYDREKTALKKLFDDELAETHKRLNEVSSEKANLEIEHINALRDNDNLKCELRKLRQQFVESQDHLKAEIIIRVESENTVKQLREQLAFQEEFYSEEMNEARRQMDTSQVSADSGLSDQYNIQLQESLQELRDQCGDQIRSNRDELQFLLDGTTRKERNCLQRENKSLRAALECSLNRNDVIQIRIEELEKLNAALKAQTCHLESALAEEKSRSDESTTEVKTLQQEMVSQLKKYQDLMDENVSLCLELAAFNKLVCNECLKFEPSAKRYRKDIEFSKDGMVTSSSAGNIEIGEVDSAGQFIKLRNKSENKVVSIGAWKLTRQADGNETVHEFGPLVQVDAGADLTVWSADSGISDSPANILVAQKWIVGAETKITLVNGSGKEEAKRMQKKHSLRRVEIRQPNEEAEKDKNVQKCEVM
ncbi:lamin Dm0-like [Bradysia coprophila]|uniref:lamin Dm0-like n=1 Tax=Bradysia coprophila TaxID=38358 RepID=UPI00187D947B|nr:lamin Dm0-like [Bradysia coprophila]